MALFQPVDRLETLPSQRIHAELTSTQTTEEKLKFLAGLNVGYVLSVHDLQSPLVQLDTTFRVNSPQPLRIYRLLNRIPRALLTDSQGPADGALGFREQVSVENGSPEAKSINADEPRILEHRSNQIEIEATANRKRLLVLLDSYYPGWQAYVDGNRVPVIAANFVYRAIEFPQGHHKVIFRYEPKSFIYGTGISASTGVGWGLAWLVSLIQRRQRATQDHSDA